MSSATPPRIPGSSVFETTQAHIAHLDTIVGPIVSSLSTWKSSVNAATTVSITLSGLQTVDGVVLVAGNTVLVKNQTDGTTNGVYVVSVNAWVRAQNLLALSSAAGVSMFVQQGTVNADRVFVCTNVSGSDVVSVNSLVFVLLAATSGSLAAGTTGQMQYNNAGALGGDVTVTDGAGHVSLVSLTASTGNVTATAGNVVATVGAVTAGTTVTAGTGVTATTGNVTATAGNMVALGHVYSSKGTYAQATSNTTPVPILTNAGNVTTLAFITATGLSSSFTLTGTSALLPSTAQFMLTKVSYSGLPATNGIPEIFASAVTSGSVTITVSNYGANALSGALVFNYIIV